MPEAITGNTVLYAGWTYTGGYITHTSTQASDGNVPVIVNGTSYNIGTAETSDGVTTVTADQDELTSQIESAETGSEVIVPITTAENAGSGAAALVLQNIEDLDTRNMALTVSKQRCADIRPEALTPVRCRGAWRGELRGRFLSRSA